MRLFLTGSPGIGKTTVIRSILKSLQGLKCAGFYTEEKREQGQRTGFKIRTLDGREGTLASAGHRKGPKVGRYTVHLEEFEGLVIGRIDPETTPADLYVIDEIGKMELFSERFRNKLTDLLSQPSNVLATIAKKGSSFLDEIKRRDDVELIEVTKQNRDRLPDGIAERILVAIKAGLGEET